MVKLPHWPIPYGTHPAEQCLDRMALMLQKMGNPHKSLPPVVHVAGTNGKGSTIAFMRYILQAAGYKVHSYTSPHISRYNERICLAGKEIDDDELAVAIEAARLAAGDMGVTFFEGTTAAAFYAFADTPADILLIETGMGGRIDATNIIVNPLATVITPISYDHTEYLGSTLTDIAWEKAGIMKSGAACIIAPQTEEVLGVLLGNAIARGVSTFTYGVDWKCSEGHDGFSFVDEDGEVDFPMPSLQGHHQIINASLAIAALQCLPGFEFTYGDLVKGLKSTRWPARLQQITRGSIARSLPDQWELWVDGAHNPAGAQVLADSMDVWDGKRVILINGRTKGRDIEGFLQPFVGKVHNLLAVPVASEPKPEDPSNIISIAHKLGFDQAMAFESLSEAVFHCLKQEKDEKLIILVTGSLYLLADVLQGDNRL